MEIYHTLDQADDHCTHTQDADGMIFWRETEETSETFNVPKCILPMEYLPQTMGKVFVGSKGMHDVCNVKVGM